MKFATKHLKDVSIRYYSVLKESSLDSDKVKCMEVPHGSIPELDTDLNLLRQQGVSEEAIGANYLLKLRSEGISNEIISSLYNEQQDEELKIAKKRASRYQLSTKGKSLNYKKQLIFSKLKNDGFSNEICNEAIDSLDFSYEILYEADTLRLESQKAYLKYHNKYEGSQLRNKIYIYLANKGFEQEKIYAVINEMEF